MKSPANQSPHTTSTTPSAVWLAEGQSSQRDMLASLQSLKAQSETPFNIIASHRHNRPEIFEFADSGYRDPSASYIDSDDQALFESAEPVMPRWQFVLEQAKNNTVKVLVTGRNGIDYEAHRPAFEAAG